MKNLVSSTVSMGALVALACLVACGAPAQSGEESAETTASELESANAATPMVTKGCPSTPPANGAACAILNSECTYGSDLRFGCRTHSVCTSTGWSTTVPACTKNAPSCPSREPQSSGGAAECTAAQSGLTCAYGRESITCSTNNGSLYIVKDGVPEKQWWGFGGVLADACPKHSPNFGASCTAAQEGASCNYGGCMNDPADPTVMGSWVICDNGNWRREHYHCIR